LRDWAYLDAKAMRDVFDACPDSAWRAFFGLLRFCGLRLGEAMRLRWVDVDFAGNRLRVNAPGTIAAVDNKKRPRVVPIEAARCPSGFAAALHLALESATEGAVTVCEGLAAGKIEKRTAAILAAAGVARYAKVHHTLRKNAEMDWAAHYPQHVASEWAGHSITVSAAHYLRVPEELYHPGAEAAQSGTKKT
jgi:integrase